MSDKARYAIERSIPELEDLEKKGLFNKKELNMIVRRRTDFEHRIAGRGSKPADYLSYVKFEKNIDRLRKKRFNRMKKFIDTTPSISNYSISKRILFIFQRGSNKFPNNMEIWAKYLKFARKQESIKEMYEVYSKLLSLHPRNVDVWLSGAKWEFEYNKNIKGARSLFKRCLRFNMEEERVWIQFIKLELNYLSKLLTRRKLLQIVGERAQLEDLKQNEKQVDENDDILLLNDINNEELNESLNNLPEMNASTLGNIEDNPVLKGDLILTLYDSFLQIMIKNLNNDERKRKILNISNYILSLIDQFDILNRIYMCDYIIKDLISRYDNEPKILILQLTLTLRYIDINDSNFVNELQTNVKFYQTWMQKSKLDESIKKDVKELYISFITEKYLQKADGETKQLLELLLKKL